MSETTDEVEAPAGAPDDSPSADEEWEDVKTGLGREHDFEKAATFTGFYVGIETVDLKEAREDGSKTATAFIFADVDTGEQVFAWGSHELREALGQCGAGDKVRITYLGRESFSGTKGPQQVKRFKVQRARRA